MKRISFVAFATSTLRLKLTDAQRVFALVAFDDVNPCDLEHADRQLARELFGDVETIDPVARRVIVASCGRGSGKTTLSAAFAVYTLATADLASAGPGDVPVFAIISPDKPTSRLSVRIALELIRKVPALAAGLESEAATGFELRRHDGRLVSLEAFAASRGGSTVRGRSILGAILDEAEFFRSDADGGYVVNDRAIYRALRPRLMEGGKIVFASTPWPVQTLMGELHEKNFGHPSTALAALAPTLLMRPDVPSLAADIAAEREIDPENAAREFDCDRDAVGSEEFFSGELLSSCMFDDEAPTGGVCYGAMDLAFQRDASAVAIARVVARDAWLIRTEEQRPRKGAPLVPSEVIGAHAALAKSFGVGALMSDIHYIESAREHLRTHQLGVLEAPGGATGKATVHVAVRELMRSKRVHLPRQPALIRQLRSIVAKPAPGGGLTIRTPRRSGNHGDVASAVILALFQCRNGAPSLVPFTPRNRAPGRAESFGDWAPSPYMRNRTGRDFRDF